VRVLCLAVQQRQGLSLARLSLQPAHTKSLCRTLIRNVFHPLSLQRQGLSLARLSLQP
jgi:hypothetical protein